MLFLHLAGISLGELFGIVVEAVDASRATVMAWGVLGAIAMAGGMLLLGQIGLFSLAFVVARIWLEAAKLLVCTMAVASVVLWLGFGIHFWLAGGTPLMAILYVWLFCGVACLRLIDFNYPVRTVLVDYSVLSVVCLALVWGLSLFG